MKIARFYDGLGVAFIAGGGPVSTLKDAEVTPRRTNSFNNQNPLNLVALPPTKTLMRQTQLSSAPEC